MKTNRIARGFGNAVGCLIVLAVPLAIIMAVFHGFRSLAPERYDSLEWRLTTYWNSLGGYARYLAKPERAHHHEEARAAYRRLLEQAIDQGKVSAVLVPHVRSQTHRDPVDRHEQEYWFWQVVLDRQTETAIDAYLEAFPEGRFAAYGRRAKSWFVANGGVKPGFQVSIRLNETFVPGDGGLSFRELFEEQWSSLFPGSSVDVQTGVDERLAHAEGLVILITSRAEALGAYYKSASGYGWPSYRYTGANLSGRVAVRMSKRTSECKFGGTSKLPEKIFEGSFKAPKDMPWKSIATDMPGSFEHGLVSCLADVLGPLWLANQALPDQHLRGSQWAAEVLSRDSNGVEILAAGSEAVLWGRYDSRLTQRLAEGLVSVGRQDVLCGILADAKRRKDYDRRLHGSPFHPEYHFFSMVSQLQPRPNCLAE